MSMNTDQILEASKDEIYERLNTMPHLPENAAERARLVDKLYGHISAAMHKANINTGAAPVLDNLFKGNIGGDHGSLVEIIHWIVALFTGQNLEGFNTDDLGGSIGNYLGNAGAQVDRKRLGSAMSAAYESIIEDPEIMIYAGRVTAIRQTHGTAQQQAAHRAIQAAGLDSATPENSAFDAILKTMEESSGPTSTPPKTQTVAIEAPATALPAKG